MKRCPQCSRAYADDTLEFCLEDGSRLIFAESVEAEIPTVTLPNRFDPLTGKIAAFPFSDPPDTLKINDAAVRKPAAADSVRERVTQKSYQAMEIAPVVVALAHNWWQWIYLDNQYYSTFSGYILSANFLMWLLLFAAGAATALLAVKRGRDKRLAIASLAVLSINLILFLVPKR